MTDEGPLRILHCFREPTGGLFRHVRDLAAAQAAAGHTVGILCDAGTGGPREDALLEALRPRLALGLHRIPMQRRVGPGDLAAAWKAYRIVTQSRPDILHGHGAKGGVHARLFGTVLRVFRFRVARIYSPHGGSLHFDPKTRRGGAVFAAEKLLARLGDATLFVCDDEKRVYEEKVGPAHGLAAVIHNGLDAAEFAPVLPAPDAADFVFVGTMRDLKGPDLLIEALAATPGVSAVLVGDGPDKARFERLARDRGLGGRLRFLPGMAAREAFALGRVVVIPSRAESFPYIVLEALAAGRPAIASRVGGVPEIFGPAQAALVAPEAGALAAKLREALANEAAFRAAMPDAAGLRARFDAAAMARAVESAYRRALL